METKLKNVEIKAIMRNRPKYDDARLGTFLGVLRQTDTFYNTNDGSKMKLREETKDGGLVHAVLVKYKRNVPGEGPHVSDITLNEISDVLSFKKEHQSSSWGRVVKIRRLYIRNGRTRVHLDTVEGLGEFIELEVVLREDESEKLGYDEIREIMKDLDIRSEDLCHGSYVDMM